MIRECDWCEKRFGDGGVCIKYLGVPGTFWMCPDCRESHDGRQPLPMPDRTRRKMNGTIFDSDGGYHD